MKKFLFWSLLVLVTYGMIELSSLGGLHFLNSQYQLTYDPVDVMSSRHKSIIKGYVEEPSKYMALHPTLGWSIKKHGAAGLYQANSVGLRGTKEYGFVPPPGILRISTFGDSFTHCEDVKNEHTWQAIMERYAPNLEILNFGVAAYGLDQAYLRYLEEGQKYKSHIVFLGFFPENIFRNVNTYRPFYFSTTGTPLTKPRFIVQGETLTLIPNPMKSRQDYQRLLLHPQNVIEEIGAYDFYYQRRYTSSPFDWSPSVRFAKIQLQEFYYGSPIEEILQSDQFHFNEESEAFHVTKKIFDEFHRVSLSNHSKPIILILPDHLDLLNYQKLKIKRYDALLSYFDSVNYQYIDLMDALKNAETLGFKPEHLFIPHYSPFANDLVAKFILQSLQQKGLNHE